MTVAALAVILAAVVTGADDATAAVTIASVAFAVAVRSANPSGARSQGGLPQTE